MLNGGEKWNGFFLGALGTTGSGAPKLSLHYFRPTCEYGTSASIISVKPKFCDGW
jgi:hypothetical protein